MPHRRAYSEPMLTFEKEQIQLPSDYDVSMREVCNYYIRLANNKILQCDFIDCIFKKEMKKPGNYVNILTA